ncbi:hypothetical protein [Actinoplanes sp. L3-i22]|uniref:hypothetical protein n=1 Tax=Actinoplanes sp. L3-i22 TaxID=2836373 RepID=UPI001C8551C2|nr:hypothetical protein [Actinoplanes sp. L3-i22]
MPSPVAQAGTPSPANVMRPMAPAKDVPANSAPPTEPLVEGVPRRVTATDAPPQMGAQAAAGAPAGMSVLSRIGVPPLVSAETGEKTATAHAGDKAATAQAGGRAATAEAGEKEAGDKVVNEPTPATPTAAISSLATSSAAGYATDSKNAKPPGRKLALTALTISLLALGGTGAVAFLVYRPGADMGHRLSADPAGRQGAEAGAQPGADGAGQPVGGSGDARGAGSQEPQRPRSAGAKATTGLPVTYAKEALDIRVGCAAIAYLDLDEPRAGSAQQVADLRYDSKCGNVPARLSLGPGAAAGSSVPTANLDADDCQRSIRNGPLGPGAEVPVKKGSALCVLTASDPAKLVLVEITEVGPTGTAGLRATSWLAR